MPRLYLSLGSRGSEPLFEKIAGQCESYMEQKCYLETDDKPFLPEKIKSRLSDCDALVVVIGKDPPELRDLKNSDNKFILSERVRFEIISAINLNLLIVPLLLDHAILPESRNVPGALKHLLESKTYRLREAFWFEDLHLTLEDIEEELDFKKDVEAKLLKPYKFNFESRNDLAGQSPKIGKLGIDSYGPTGLGRLIDSENLILAEAQRRGDRAGEKDALSSLGLAYAWLGQTQRAIQFFLKQLEIVHEIGNINEKCALLANLGDAFAISGNTQRAKTYYQDQLSLAKSGDHRDHVGSAWNGLGFVYVKQDQVLKGIECYKNALAVCRELENHEKELELLVGIGLNYQKQGNLSQAIQFLELALPAARYLENRKEEARVLVDLGDIFYQAGNPERADFYLTRAEELLNILDGPWVDSIRKRLKKLREPLNDSEK